MGFYSIFFCHNLYILKVSLSLLSLSFSLSLYKKGGQNSGSVRYEMGDLAWMLKALTPLHMLFSVLESGESAEVWNPSGRMGNHPLGAWGRGVVPWHSLALMFLSLTSTPLLQIQAAVHLPR